MSRLLDVGFGERVPPFDGAVARAYAKTAAGGRRAGRPIDEANRRIAAMSRSRGAALATRSMRDIVDPWSVAPT